MKKIFRNTVAGILATVIGVYGLNAAVIHLAQPANIQNGQEIKGSSQFGSVSIVLMDDLKAGGLGNLSSGTTGYVNVLSAEKVIYLNGSEYSEAPSRNTYIYRHEYAHILQKELVAEKVGGYPNVANPWVSFSYYYHILKLNSDYEAVMPKPDKHAHSNSAFSGLEIGADCFAQSSDQKDPLTYAGTSFCDDEKRYIAFALFVKRWPLPMTDEEKGEKLDRSALVLPKKTHSPKLELLLG